MSSGWTGLLETLGGGKKMAIGPPLGLSHRLVGRQNGVSNALCYVLFDRGYTEEDLTPMLGENVLRVMDACAAVATSP